MVDSTDNRPRSMADRRSGYRLLAVAVLVLVGTGEVRARDAGADVDAEETTAQASSVTVRFEDLGIVADRDRLVVDYAIAREDWKRTRRTHLALWLQLRVPADQMHPKQWSAYSVPLDERTGRRAFPRWLTTETDADPVATCLLGAGPGDNLVSGRGYACTDRVRLPVRDHRSPTASRSHTVELQYRAGPPYIPYAPWVEPRVPNLQGPFDQLPAP